jgi:putative sterol carrier protein
MTTAREYFNVKVPELIANNPAKVKSINGVFQFHIEGEGGGSFVVDCKTPSVSEGTTEKPDCTLTVNCADFEAILAKKLNPMMAFSTKKLKVTGNLPLSLKLQTIL